MDDPGTSMGCAEVFGGNLAVDHDLQMPDLDVWVYSMPHGGANEGGDVVLLSRCGMGQVAKAFLGDVTGHGAVVAPIARSLRDLVRGHMNDHDHVDFFRALNEAAGEGSLAGSFATMVAVLFDRPKSILVYSYAGHPHMLYAPDAESPLTPLLPGYCPLPGGVTDLAIGMIPGTRYFQSAVPFDPGAVAVLYSDAWIEAPLPGGGRTDEEMFLDTANRCPRESSHVFRRELAALYEEEHGVTAFADDLSLVVLRRTH